MRKIYIDTIEITIDNERVVEIMECLTVDTNQEILIRNKKETKKFFLLYLMPKK